MVILMNGYDRKNTLSITVFINPLFCSRSLAMWGESETASNGSGGGGGGGRGGRRDGRGGDRDRDDRDDRDGGASAAWGFESNNTWRPPSLMTLTTNGLGGAAHKVRYYETELGFRVFCSIFYRYGVVVVLKQLGVRRGYTEARRGLPNIPFLQSTTTMSTQTDMNGDAMGIAPGCICTCNCGAREAARIVSREL